MRNLTYAEATVAALLLVGGSGLGYVTLFKPALERIEADRAATQMILFSLARDRREQNVPHKAPAALTVPLPVSAPQAQGTRHQRREPSARDHARKPNTTPVLDLDESADPLSGLDLTND